MNYTVKSLKKALDNKEVSSLEVTEEYLKRAKKNKHNAYITVTEDIALRNAKEEDEKRIKGEKTGILSGIPGAVKDNISTKDVRTTCASEILKNYISIYDATVISKLKDSGFVMLGKTNMDEFAMGSTSTNSYYNPVINPVDNLKIAGGSSGGSAAAVVSNECVFALGSDTGGSIRLPASYCNVCGIKPTYGAVSRYGLIAFASSLDHIGVITKNVEDSGIVLNEIMGYDKKDLTSKEKEDNILRDINKGLKGIRIALPYEFIKNTSDKLTQEKIMNSALIMEKEGAIVDTVSIKDIEQAVNAYYIISSAEASSNLARYDGIKYGKRTDKYNSLEEVYKFSRNEGFGEEVKRRIMLGSYVLSSGYYDDYYKNAVNFRNKIKEEYKKIFKEYDCVMLPTTPSMPQGTNENNNITKIYNTDVYTVCDNLTGCPSITIPCERKDGIISSGIQLTTDHFKEHLLLQIAKGYEDASYDRGGSYGK